MALGTTYPGSFYLGTGYIYISTPSTVSIGVPGTVKGSTTAAIVRGKVIGGQTA